MVDSVHNLREADAKHRLLGTISREEPAVNVLAPLLDRGVRVQKLKGCSS